MAEIPVLLETTSGDGPLAEPEAGTARTGPIILDEHHAQSITELTRERYRSALRGFVEWLDDHELRPESPEEFDDLAVEFKNASEVLVAPGFRDAAARDGMV